MCITNKKNSEIVLLLGYIVLLELAYPDSKFHVAHMGPQGSWRP